MAQSLRAPAALSEVLSSVPSNHVVVHNHLSCNLVPSSGTEVYMQKEIVYIINKLKKSPL